MITIDFFLLKTVLAMLLPLTNFQTTNTRPGTLHGGVADRGSGPWLRLCLSSVETLFLPGIPFSPKSGYSLRSKDATSTRH